MSLLCLGPPAAAGRFELTASQFVNWPISQASISYPAELEALPGIGPTTAARIVRSRGGRPFARIEELQTRGLVSARVFADIKDMVTTR
ncbi:MAG: ComEA family DNA-binding protein [Candidatus Limnocylindria bacterium]